MIDDIYPLLAPSSQRMPHQLEVSVEREQGHSEVDLQSETTLRIAKGNKVAQEEGQESEVMEHTVHDGCEKERINATVTNTTVATTMQGSIDILLTDEIEADEDLMMEI
jgi:hypothetical protein